MNKFKSKNIGYLFLFISSLVLVFSNINLHYLSTYAPDYQYYKDYISYYYGDYLTTGREQGLIYFFLISFFIKIGSDHFSLYNSDQLVSNAIQLTNVSLYLLGLLGLFYLLRQKGFKTKSILLTFTILNFFPQTLNMILTMKPEIFAFASLPWSILLIMLFFEKNNYKYLYFSILPNTLLLTSKASIVAPVLLIYFYIIFKEKFNIFNKKFITFFIIFVLFLTPIIIENFDANGKHIYQHTYEVQWTPEVADPDFLYTINFQELLFDPYRHTHANSLIGMIVLDTFGDYYQWYAYHDHSAFMYMKRNFDSISYITHWRQFFSMILTISLYLFIFYFYFKDKKNKIFYLFPFFGIFVLLLQAYGIPQKGFDKETAELFKTHYYAFLLVICLAFVIINLINRDTKFGYSILGVFIFTTSFLYGLPNDKPGYIEFINEKNQHIDTCYINAFFIEGFDKSDCNNKAIDICEFDQIIYTPAYIDLYNEEQYNDRNNLSLQTLINSEGDGLTPQSKKECLEAVNNGFVYDSPYIKDIKIPFFNLIYFVLFLISMFYLIRKKHLFH